MGAKQLPLIYGSLTLCDPLSNDLDGYEPPDIKHPMYNAESTNIPGTKGRIMTILDVGGTDQSALKLEFVCESNFPSDMALDAWIQQVMAAETNAAQPLQTVYYGLLNGPTLLSKTDCKMTIRQLGLGKYGDGSYWIKYMATFDKYSVD